MESKEASSVILNLMGLDKVPNQHPVRDKQKVLSKNYQQKVASIGVKKKRSSHQGMNTSEKDKFEDGLEVSKHSCEVSIITHKKQMGKIILVLVKFSFG